MRLVLGLLLVLFFAGNGLAEMMSVAVHTANIRSAPDEIVSVVELQAPRYYPLVSMSERNGFVHVRDYQGRTGWIHESLLSSTKGVVVEVRRANVRKGPGTEHPVIFRAQKGVTFKVLSEQEKWLEVKHENGRTGWVYKPLTWGQ